MTGTLLLLGLALSLLPARAELPSARLLTIFPAGGKAGSTVEVTATGKDLDGSKRLLASHPGISAVLKSAGAFTVKISADVPPGVYDLRVMGKFGVSNPRAFAVGLLNEAPESEDIHRPEKSQNVAFGTTINGRATADAADYFHFSARQGEFLVARCEADELDSRFEPVLVLMDRSGRELTRGRTGGLIEWPVSEDGDFTLSVHDAIFRGGPEFFYRLSIGALPQIDSMLSVATLSSNAVKFVVLGHNLPGGRVVPSSQGPAQERVEIELSPGDSRLQKARIRLPAEAGEDLLECRIKSERGVSNPVLTTLPHGSLQFAGWLKHPADEGQPISPPCEVAGEFARSHQPTSFSFEARKGDVYWMEVLSQQLGFPSDPFLVVQRIMTNHSPSDVLVSNDSDENLGGSSFNTKSRDPKDRFEAKEDGYYRIQIKDLFTHVHGTPPPAYRLVVRKPAPDFALVAMPAAPLQAKKDGKQLPVSTTTLRSGATTPIKVLAFRRDGFNGPIELSVAGLPDGVSASPSRIAPGKNSALLLLHADDEAEENAAVLKITGSGESQGTRFTREARPVTLLWDVNDSDTEPVTSRTCAQFILGTLAEEEPVRLCACQNKTWEATAGEKFNLPLTIERSAQFASEPFTVTPAGQPVLDGVKEFQIDANATNSVYQMDLKQLKLAPGRYTFALHGLVKAKREKPKRSDVEFTLYSSPITLQVNPAPNTATK